MQDEDASTNAFLTPPIRLFLEACLWEKGIQKVGEKVKEDMILDLAPRLQDWLWQAVFSQLPEDALPEWKSLEKDDVQSVWNFFRAKLPNLDDIMEKAMAEFKEIYVG